MAWEVSQNRYGLTISAPALLDTLSLILKESTRVAESDEDKPGVILDYDEEGNLVSLEIPDASKRVTDTRRVEFNVTE